MRIKIPIVIALLALFILACTQEDVSYSEEFEVVQQQFALDYDIASEVKIEDEESFITSINSIDPLIIETSENWEVISHLDKETNGIIAGIVEKGSIPSLDSTSNEPCDFYHKEGYKFNTETACFERSVWTLWPNCTIDFHVYTHEKFRHVICLSTFFQAAE